MSELPDIYGVTKRKTLTPKQKMQMFLDHEGICVICKARIDGVRETWDEHVIPLADGGGNEQDNRGPAHERCARKKSGKEATNRARARRHAERHHGARKASETPMPFGRKDRLKKKMRGGFEDRETGQVYRTLSEAMKAINEEDRP